MSNFDFSYSMHQLQATLQTDQQHQLYPYQHRVKDMHNCHSGKVPKNVLKNDNKLVFQHISSETLSAWVT